MLYCSQGPELTNDQAQMESVRAELYRKLSSLAQNWNACYSKMFCTSRIPCICLFNILATLIILSPQLHLPCLNVRLYLIKNSYSVAVPDI